MNLENLNVTELGAQEKVSVDGGIWNIVTGLVIALEVEIIQDWENFKAGLNNEPYIPNN